MLRYDVMLGNHGRGVLGAGGSMALWLISAGLLMFASDMRRTGVSDPDELSVS